MRKRRINITDFELGWIVALLEGEGYFGLNVMHRKNRSSSQTVTLKMTDEDTVVTYGSIISKLIGKTIIVREKDEKRPNHMNSFECSVYGENARVLMRAVVPHMHYRRRQRIWQSLNNYKVNTEDNLSSAQILKLVKNVS